MLRVVGREVELSRLRRAAAQPPQLIVVRGRRRVGKSFLVNAAYERHERFVYFQADASGERLHLDLLAAECARLSGAPVRFEDWNAALAYVGQLGAESPIVLALDEFQWMWRAFDSLPSTIMRHFDDWQRREVPVCLVIAGSALTMMEQLVEGDKPLFGRADARPLIEPFDFRLAAEFGPADAAAEDKLRRYAVLGGTAQYQAWAGSGSLESVLRERILPPGESLNEEPLQLLRGERDLRDPGAYFEILRAIAAGRTRFNEIQQAAGSLQSSALAKRLERLGDLGYIELRSPIAGNGTRSYTITDGYFRFWFRFVMPNRSRLQSGRVDEVCSEIMAGLDDFMGPAFERVCRHWARVYAPLTHPYADARTIGAYWTRTHDVEVDVVALTGKTYRGIGSCKWSASADTHDLDRLVAQRDRIPGAGAAPLSLFARGFHPALIERAAADGVHLIGADELYGRGVRSQRAVPVICSRAVSRSRSAAQTWAKRVSTGALSARRAPE